MKSLIRLLVPFVALLALALSPGAALAKQRHHTLSLGDRTPLKQGQKGHDVRVLQDFLTRAGQKTSVDGQFGKGTKLAVRAFEASQRRPVDGRVDGDDVKVLRDVIKNGAAVGSAGNGTGGAVPTEEQVTRVGPGAVATVGLDGLAVAPDIAPPVVKAIIAAGNRIATKPYRYGGGHGKWEDTGYDCSGSVSYALHGAGLMDAPLTSGGFESWGEPGAGEWVTTYANGGHMYMVVAGLRFDTSGRSGAGTRWQAEQRSTSAYTARHPLGL